MSDDDSRYFEAGEYYDHPPNQPAWAPVNQQSQPSQGVFEDGSRPLFSTYLKAADEDDKKMIARWRKDADEILIFTGLFSAAVAALLAVTVQYLIPNSQDTSSFYLRNIYQVLADPNATHVSVPSPIAEPPPFSPPNYAVWVNSLWSLSLVISLICTLLASSLHQWARRYIRVTQRADYSLEKRARIRAFYANGLKILPNSWVVEALPTLLHLSLFLFFAGLIILLINVNHAVFNSVAWLIGLFSIIYGLITLLPIVRHDCPYYSPLSPLVWYMYTGTRYLFIKVLFTIKSGRIVEYKNWQYLRDLGDRYRGWILGGREKAAEETASERSSDIDADILGWTIDALGDDNGMTNFFDAIPGFFKSEPVKDLKRNLPDVIRKKIWMALNGFFERTLKSNSVIDNVKALRLDIGMKVIDTITIPDISSIPKDILFKPWGQELQNIEMGHIVAGWCTNRNRNIAEYARCISTRILASVRERDDSWIALAIDVLRSPEDSIREYVARGDDSVSLAILISVARRHIHSDFYDWGLLSMLYKLNIHNTPPELQHAFCELWNEYVEKALTQLPDKFHVGLLRLTRLLYIRLHQGTPAVPTRFSASTPDFDHILYHARSYPLCNVPGHQIDHRESSLSLASPAISPVLTVHTDPYPLDGNMQQVVAAPWAVPNIGQTLSIAPTSSPAPASTAPTLNQPLGSYDADPASTSTLPSPASHAIPTSPSHIPRLPNPELLALLSCTSLAGPSDSATLSRARGLFNQGNMHFPNAVLQLLVYCPPFWNLFSDLGRLTGQTGQRGHGEGQQTSSGTTLLVDATVRLLDEFAYKNEDDGTEPFTPMYVYDAMKEKSQFDSMLWDAEEHLGIYLNALNEELLAFTALKMEERKEGSQLSVVDVCADTIKPPISRIFDGTFRMTVRMTGQDDIVKIESWRTLQLDIQPDSVYTVQDALALISRYQSVQVEPSDPSEASQQVTMLIEILPLVLIVHLKRFLYDTVTGGVVKNPKPVQCSSELEIPPDMMVPTTGQPAEPARYTLCGVLYHHGMSASGGHYTVDVLDPNTHDGHEEAWLHIDDEIVSTVQQEDVFGRHGEERTDDQCAYLLFYRRTAFTQT